MYELSNKISINSPLRTNKNNDNVQDSKRTL